MEFINKFLYICNVKTYGTRYKTKDKRVYSESFSTIEVSSNKPFFIKMNNEVEIWKEIPNYEGVYQCSSFGRIKSLPRIVSNNVRSYFSKEKILKLSKNKTGYLSVVIYKDKKPRTFDVHKLVAITFLNHNFKSYDNVIDHIDNNRLNNNLNNLQIISQRVNISKGIKNKNQCTSNYIGVHWNSRKNKWKAAITINKKTIGLGSFDCEIKAHEAYINKVNELALLS